ncbi:hypothetical protein SUGI_0045600 [Cryptomeria japonica]|uniref:uncharacterized protein LOC131043616 n=1 Tax=Cryptomeria japonica TaxID=3369 RepID=UPI002408D62E|nr:uncharacterized protein LOC131043616 [Cryptomeria japonica]XP_057832832.2 uncharacterized protein LOC131043616 [Cryptomeria japonica]XP_057832833.2 uncharacterized protein LOC131043616 [Cryptomeria japonica]GLJ06699.1 hypothetical protein SUGI_0045600 [Cryptomeria japonica]
MASGSISADERFANMIHRQQLLQKEDINQLTEAQSVSDAHEEFRRGLEVLVRDHFHTCMTLASCSSAHDSGINGRRDRINRFHEDHDDNEEEEGDQLVRRRRRSEMEEDLTDSSAARRHQSRILARWAARQAQEMITTMERQNRESELLALAGLHAVSMLDSSFLRESSASRSEGRVERPSTRASSLLQMWRELEEDQRADRARGRMRARMVHSEVPEIQREHIDDQTYHENAGVGGRDHTANTSSVNTLLHQSNQQMNVSQGGSDFSGDRQWMVNDQNDNEAPEAGHRHGEYRDWEERQLDSENVSREQSPELGEGETERVRQIVRGWMTENGITENSSNLTHGSGHRTELLGENERERVRLAREWVHTASQQRDVRGSRREQSQRHGVQPGLVRRQARQREVTQSGLVAEMEERAPEHVNRDALRLRGRQAFMDLLVRIGRERQRELQGLLEHRAVSEFAHRNRIQSLLRGRFLRTGPGTEEERPPSTAARELGQLRQRRTVSALRLENIVRGQAVNHSDGAGSNNSNIPGDSNFNTSRNDQSRLEELQNTLQDQSTMQESHQAGNGQDLGREMGEVEGDIGEVRRDAQEIDMEGVDGDSEEDTVQDVDRNWQENAEVERVQERLEGTEGELHRGWQDDSENADRDWQGDATQDVDREWQEGAIQDVNRDWQGNASQDVESDWHQDATQEVARDWQEHPSQREARAWQGIATRRQVNDFEPSEDTTAYNMELRELLGRRSVSTVLASEFRESLDQLIRSYVQRQGHNPVAWDLERPVQRTTNVQEEDPEPQEAESRNEGLTNVTNVPGLRPPPPPPPPPTQPLWQQGTAWATPVLPPPPQTTWSRHPLQRSDIEWEVVNDLRSEMTRIQQGMISMQRMLEACMDMQLELQRSVRQEVSAALNRSNEGQSVPDESIDGSKWVTVRKGMCCVCCDIHIDSLLYRCGHMCTCLKCANELLQNSGKCPMCRAPIVEVVRAYCVL